MEIGLANDTDPDVKLVIEWFKDPVKKCAGRAKELCTIKFVCNPNSVT